jgi:hypothetical protein
VVIGLQEHPEILELVVGSDEIGAIVRRDCRAVSSAGDVPPKGGKKGVGREIADELYVYCIGRQTHKYDYVHLDLSTIAILSLLDEKWNAVIYPDVGEGSRFGDTHLW